MFVRPVEGGFGCEAGAPVGSLQMLGVDLLEVTDAGRRALPRFRHR